MDSTDPTVAKKKRKSLFDVPPEGLETADPSQQSLDILLRYSLQNVQPSNCVATGFKDPVFEKRLKLALEKNFNYIRKKDTIGTTSNHVVVSSSNHESSSLKNFHRPAIRSGRWYSKLTRILILSYCLSYPNII